MATPSSERPPKVFFSYARRDSEFALKLAHDLREAGANLWVDQFDIPIGAGWDRSVQAALNACPSFLVILSPSAGDSENVMDEITVARDKNKNIIPILYQKCEIPLRLTRLQYIDFTVDYDTAFPKLCEELGVDPISAQPVSPSENKQTEPSQIKQNKPVALTPSFDKGLYGGLIGGATAGLIVGILYYLASQDVPHGKVGIPLVLFVLGYGAIVGATFGIFTQQAILWFALGAMTHQSSRLFRESEIAGGVLGGALAGVITGALGGLWFGHLSTPMITPGLVMVGALIGVLCIVLCVLLYDYRGHWRDVLRALVLALVFSAFLATIGVAALQSLEIDDYFTATATRSTHIYGGAMIGFVVLIVLGLLFGLTLRLHGRRSTKSN